MVNYTFNEESYENALCELFEKTLGYQYASGYDLDRDHSEPLLLDNVASCLMQINRGLPREAIVEAIAKVKTFSSRDIKLNNGQFLEHLQNGVEVKYIVGGEQKNDTVALIDYKDINNNEFLCVRQYSVIENGVTKRPDIVLFVNGFPLVDMELKSCSREETDASEAYLQIRNRIHDIPSYYNYNMMCVISDMTHSKVGTITTNEDRYMEWRSKTGDYEETRFAQFDTFFEGIFIKSRLINIIKNYILFCQDGRDAFKAIAGYHQYFAVEKAVNATIEATETDGKAGVVWHTQGSGKSLSMVFYAHLLAKRLKKCTMVVLTDRNDLDDQLYETFCSCKKFLRQTPVQAANRVDLKDKLKDRVAGGIFFTTMQKFEEASDALSERRDIIVMADEAHRSQYGLNEKVDKDGKITIGYARLVRNSLPNATFIGFTGTPIDLEDRSTVEVFGNYIDVYDITQAVADKATKPIFYENRVIKLSLDDEVLTQIDDEYEIIRQDAEEYHIEKSKKQLGTLEALLSRDKTINTLCEDITKHYGDRRHILTGKAMIVAYSKTIAIKIWHEMIRLNPAMAGKIKVVISHENTDPEEWRQVDGMQTDKKELAKQFKDNNSDFKIAIVVDMWLTGFDVPSLNTMYIYKHMKGHNLMQAIARVNRVFKDKEGGLIVDYVGIASALRKAMKKYTLRDQNNFTDNNISRKALPIFKTKLAICRDFMHGLDYSKFIKGTDLDRANTIKQGINHITCNEDNKKKYIKEALALHQSATLCLSLIEYETRLEIAFLEAVRVAITRIAQSKKFSLKDINMRISELLMHSVKDSQIINIFADENIEFSIFDEKYINNILNMKEKNLAVELLARLLNDQIKLYQKTNLVQSELFSEKMKRILISYNNGLLSNIEVLDELRNMADGMRLDSENGVKLGLSKDEKAFYDALLKPQALKDYYEDKNESLLAIVKDLTEMLNNNRTIDWQKKETARASMRSMIKRLLKKYDYPPGNRSEAVQYVIAQCEQWADNLEN